MTKHTLPFVSLIALCLAACSSSPTPTPKDEPPVATNASEAWPTAPSDVPSISGADILSACSIAGACSGEVMNDDQKTRLGLVDVCVFDAVFSAERAIPMSGFGNSNERAEFWTRCVLDHANDCNAVSACKTPRDSSIYCEEDGCHASDSFNVSCNGDVATLTGASKSFTRDCARAFAKCDASSPTGCDDRHYTKCDSNEGSADRCDGNVRLGCDGASLVSYHDCTRLGGACDAAAGTADCSYSAAEPACDPNLKSSSCNGGTLQACVNGRQLSMASPICK